MFVWVRSLVFQVWFFGTVVLFASAAALVGVFPGASFRVARAWCHNMLLAGKYLCGLDYVIEGTENIPDEPSVILIKHSSVWEAYAQVVIFPRQCWVLKRELFRVPFFGWGLRALKPIAIDRGAGGTAVRQVIEQGKERLAEGIWVTVFPEGTRVAPGTTKKYGISGAALAHEARVRVVPVAHNAGDYWPRRSFLKRPGLIRVCIGPPIDGGARSPKETNALVRDWIETKMGEISESYKRKSDDDESSAPGERGSVV